MTDSKSRCVVEISTDTRPIVYLTIDRLSTDYRPTIDRLLTDYRPTIDRLSTDYRPTIDRLSTDYRPTVDRLSTDCRPTIDRLSTAISTAMSTDISVDITHSKQDPSLQPNRSPPSLRLQHPSGSLPWLFRLCNTSACPQRTLAPS